MIKREKDFMLFGLDADKHSYRGLYIFLFIYLGATLFAAILTPPVYWTVEYLNSIFHTETTEWLVRKGVDVFYDRIRWIPIVAGLPIMMKMCGLLSIKYLGLGFSKNNILLFLKYIVLGATLAVVIFALQAAFCTVVKNPEAGLGIFAIVKFFAGVIGGVLALALLEETVFRGLIFRSCYTAWGTILAFVFTSAFFAYKHFKVPNEIWQNIEGGVTHADWYTGFIVAYYDTVGVFMTFNLVEFLTLFMLSALLILLYLRKKVLWPCVGFHMGIVLAIQTYRHFFNVFFTPEQQRIFGSAGLSSGYLALSLLTLLFVVFLFLPNKKNAQIESN